MNQSAGEHAQRGSAIAQPNVILIVADDMGAADMGYLGSPDLITPNLDRLARSGVFLTDAHVSASVCAPSRAGLITGQYQQRFGAECNGTGPGGINVPGDTATIADALLELGYQTGAIGKWHLGTAPECHPNAQGFEHFSGFLGGSRGYFSLDSPRAPARLERNGVAVPEDEVTYLTDWLTAESVQQIRERDTSRPMFMYVAYNAPHTPMHATQKDLERFPGLDGGRKTYAAMMLALDRGVGRILDELETQGIADDTLVVFLSDNGGATTNSSDNGPWRGMKGSLWEGGQQVPFIIRWPNGGLGSDDSNSERSGVLASSLDLFPTILAAAGGTSERTDGLDLAPLLRAQVESDRGVLYWRRAVAAGVRDGDWKLWRVRELDGGHRYGLVNLADDPTEQTDLAADRPQVVQRLTAKLEAWEQTLQPPRWLEGERWEQNQRHKHDFSVIGRAAERGLP